MSERTEILEPVIAALPLGYSFSRYAAIREVKFGSGAGKLDLTVVTDEPSLLLIEAKFQRSPDSRAKVLGQIVLYMSHALTCPTDVMIRALMAAANTKMNQRPGFWNGSPRQPSEPDKAEMEAWVRGAVGASKSPRQIRGLIAFDEWSKRDDRRLGVPIRLLTERNFPISILLKSGQFKLKAP